MTETEKLLTQAQDMALRAFDQPSETVVMDLFRRLCEEQDRAAWAQPGLDSATVH